MKRIAVSLVGVVSLVLVLATAAPTAPESQRTGNPLAFIVPSGDEHDDSSALYTVEPDGSHLRRLVAPAQEAAVPSWSPDGKRIAFGAIGGTYIAGGLGRHRHRVLGDRLWDWGAQRWSPEGSRFVLTRTAGDDVALAVFNLVTHKTRILATGSVVPGAADWSPDGRTILFAGDTDTGGVHTSIYMIRSDGSGLRKLIAAPHGVDLDVPRFSPEGKRLLYSWHRGSTTFFYLARADGTRRKRLVLSDADATGSWSRDGSQIVFGATDIRILTLSSQRIRKVDLPICRRKSCQDLDW